LGLFNHSVFTLNIPPITWRRGFTHGTASQHCESLTLSFLSNLLK